MFATSDFDFCDLLDELFHMAQKIFFEKYQIVKSYFELPQLNFLFCIAYTVQAIRQKYIFLINYVEVSITKIENKYLCDKNEILEN